MQSAKLNGHAIDYDVTGPRTGAADAHPPLLLLSGWCQDHRLFRRVVDLLSEDRRVIRMDWRGHGVDRTETGEFGVAEMADDVVALLDELGVAQVVPVSTSHGGWANLEVADRLGAARVPRVVVVDWLMLEAPADFLAGLRVSYDRETWREGRQALFDEWLATADCPPVAEHLTEEMAAFGFEMWARSCRVIEAAYLKWGSPLARMAAFEEPRPIVHLYSQPGFDGYHAVQREFAQNNPWFSAEWLGGRTHFPTLESPAEISARILAFADGDA